MLAGTDRSSYANFPVSHYDVSTMKFFRESLSSHWKRTLYIMFFAQLMTGVGYSSIFPFLPLYVKELGSTTGLSIELLAGLVYSTQAFSMMIASPIWGTLADRYGRKLMVERAMFGSAILLLLMAFVRSAEELILLRTVQGLVTGVVGAANALVASEAPRERSGYAMGLLQMGLGTGIAFGPMIGGALADAFSYAVVFYVTGALLFLAGATVLVGVKEEFVPIDAPVEKGKGFIVKWREIFSIPGVFMAYSMNFMAQLGRMMIIPIIPLFVEMLLVESDTLNTFTGLVTGVSSAATTLCAVYFGRLGDRVGHRRILISSLFFSACMYLPQSLVEEGWQLLILYALVGVGLGGIIPSVNALLAHYTLPGEEGAVYGLDNSIRAGARSLAPMLGSGLALWFGLRGTFVATALVFVFAGFLAYWRLPKHGSVSSAS
jgi:DHA1 family multidrug resistance protein-like MFS transporter